MTHDTNKPARIKCQVTRKLVQPQRGERFDDMPTITQYVVHLPVVGPVSCDSLTAAERLAKDYNAALDIVYPCRIEDVISGVGRNFDAASYQDAYVELLAEAQTGRFALWSGSDRIATASNTADARQMFTWQTRRINWLTSQWF